MNFNSFTIKSQEAIQKALEFTRVAGQQQIEPLHLLKGIFSEGESLVKFIFQKVGANMAAVVSQTDREIDMLPKVSGGEPYLSRTSNDVLQKSLDIAKKQGDEYVTLEAMLMALFQINSAASTVLKDAGLNEKELQSAIDELRKGKKATDQSAEETYNSLNKYAINLNERARSGKLDPVIGRDDEIRRVLQILSRRTKNNPMLIGHHDGRVLARQPSPKGLHSASCVATCLKTSAPSRFSRLIWVLWLPEPSIRANSRNV